MVYSTQKTAEKNLDTSEMYKFFIYDSSQK